MKIMLGVGKEIPPTYPIEKCPKCKGLLAQKNGSNSYPGFSKGGANWWVCIECRCKFEVIDKDEILN